MLHVSSQSMVTSAKPLVIFLMGPTGIGKTELAIDLAQRLPVDIISVDSAMVYRTMDIGTAKPSPDELAKAPHQLIDVCDPSYRFSVADFCRLANEAIHSSLANDRIPLLVGGTHMYYHSLLNGLSDMPASSEQEREQVEAEAAIHGWPAMHQVLAAVDPEYASTLHPNHSQRIARGLIVYRASGKTMTQWRAEPSQSNLADTHHIAQMALLPEDRSWLHDRLAQRFDQMMTRGFLHEVRALVDRRDLNVNLPSVRSVGYRQLWDHILGELSLSQAREKSIIATRQLAKRQLTWLRKWPNLYSLGVAAEQKAMMGDSSGRNNQKTQDILTSALNYLPLRAI